ncbi:hypothetical protein FRC15_000894 [Serendipita sp. 397]|nr:hypothetical protein FRC15_000894 [Serendipita sp. 397]
MQLKTVTNNFPVPTNLKLVYARIVASRLTICFFVVSILHFSLQISFQAWAFNINLSASSFLNDILNIGGFEPHDNFAVLVPLSKSGTTGGELRLCTHADMIAHRDIYQCPIIWKGRANTTAVDYAASLPYPSSSATATPTPSTVDPTTQFIGSSSSRSVPTSSVGQTLTRGLSTSPLVTRSQRTSTSQASTRTQNSDRPTQSVDDDDDDDDRLDRSRLVKRDQDVAAIPRLPFWRRDRMTVVPILRGSVSSLSPEGGNEAQTATTAEPSDNSSVIGVNIPFMVNPVTNTTGVTLSRECVKMILWPNQIIHNTKRQDVTFMAFQFWVLGMSIVAILNESIPHIAASLITHILATAWSVYQIFNTASFRNEFTRSTIQSGLCGGINLLPDYWTKRRSAELAVLIVNCVSLIAFIILSWRLVKLFGWQTFKRIGASIQVNRIYMIVLIFSIGLQMSFFFVIAMMGVWVDILCSSILGSTADNKKLYMAFAIMACILMVPWLWLGWIAVRREANKMMSAFVTICILLIAGWAALFACQTFRWQFVEWNFFATMSIASGIMMTGTTILGIVCFYNFHKGLKRFLGEKPEDPDKFTTITSRDVEKGEVVDFPVAGPIPTYAVAFGGASTSKAKEGFNSPRSSFDSGDIGSPLHDPVFLDPYAPGYQKSSEANIPPRFRAQGSFAESQTTYLSSAQNVSRKASTSEMTQVDRADSLASTDSGSNPFSLDRGNSIRSGTSGTSGRSGRSDPAVKPRTYATAGSHFVPTIETRHQQEYSRKATRGWAIE